MQVLKQSKENLFGRIEVEALIEGIEGATPNRAQVTQELAKAIGKSAEVIAVKKIEHKFGRTKAVVYARVYETREQKEKLEKKALLDRTGKKRGAKKEEAPAAKEEEKKEVEKKEPEKKEEKEETK